MKLLKRRIPTKPETYTEQYPKRMKDALFYYCNMGSVHGVQRCTKMLNEENWPLPLWYNSDNIKVGFWNKFFYKRQYNSWKKGVKFKGLTGFDFFSVPLLNKVIYDRSIDDALTEAFKANSNFAFQQLILNPTLNSKRDILLSIKRSYKSGDWIACISTTFPILDFIARKILQTNNLSTQFTKICKLFEKNGFKAENADDLMPHVSSVDAFTRSLQEGEIYDRKAEDEKFEKMLKYDFGLIGPALSSFIRFGNIYYGHYKEDSKKENYDDTFMNRHAILHGSINHFGTKVNSIKLLTFLFLILELEEVFEILLAE